MSFKETNYENAIIQLFKEKLGYIYQYGPDISRDYKTPYLADEIISSLERINKGLPKSAIDEAFYKITHFESRNTLQINEVFTDCMQNGVEVTFSYNGETKNDIVKLIDFKNTANNSFYIINQWTVEYNAVKRPDLVVFINGFPLIVIELKSCSREETDVSEAYTQIRNYYHDIAPIFYYNAFCVISDMAASRVGTITSDESRYMDWKTVSGDYEETKIASFSTLFEGMFEKERLLDILKNFVLFSHETDKPNKILAAYHQYYAVKKAVLRTAEAAETDGKGGVFWHTQGSGKSLSMVFYAKLLREKLKSLTLVVLTDRNDLDGQLYTQFSNCKKFLRQEPQQASDRKDLQKLLGGRVANGIIFTTMQKFEESADVLSERRDIVLMADEAHRSQYGLDEKVDSKGKVTIGYARLVRNSLPNATFIGFTGTPVTFSDRSTLEIFGDYIDIYDMTQAVKDGATKPIFYENRVVQLDLDQKVLADIDQEYEKLKEHADEVTIEKSKKELGKMDSILGSDETIDSLCKDIVKHYEQRSDILTGKAMIVAYSRPIAIKILSKILEIKPSWKDGFIEVVMTSDNKDPESWKQIIGTKSKKDLANDFKNNDSKMKIAIVVDMWLTGFDVPSLATMYIYKPMKGHNLMQAIARVNRVFKDKEGGLVVDYIGIASALKKAMNEYTMRDKENFSDMNISETALPKFMEKLSVCRDLIYGFDYAKFISGTDFDRANLIVDGANFIVKNEDNKNTYAKEAMLLKQAQTLCRSLLEYDLRMEFAFFEAIRIVISKITSGKKLSIHEINAQINEFLKHAVKSEKVVNIFQEKQAELSIFDADFLNEIANMQQKNLAVEMLEKLLKEQVTIFQRSNLVKSEIFSEKMKKLMNSYRNAQISNAEVIAELIKMAEDIRNDNKEAESMNLSTEEKAFYDAITKPENVKDFFENEDLIAITKELTESLQKSRTIDWQKKESARAGMRKMIKRLLKKYGYPPDEAPNAIEAVIAQCELFMSENS